MEEQIQHIEEAEAQKLSAFSVSQADIDNELCRHGSGFANGKLRIYKFIEDMPSSDAAITFLKKEYGIGGHSHTYLNGESGFVDHDGKGIHFSNYNYKEKHTITWKAVARRLRELIALDRYLTEKEKAYLPEYEAKEAERRLQLAEEAAAKPFVQRQRPWMSGERKRNMRSHWGILYSSGQPHIPSLDMTKTPSISLTQSIRCSPRTWHGMCLNADFGRALPTIICSSQMPFR